MALNQRIEGIAVVAPEVYSIVKAIQKQMDDQADAIVTLTARVAALEAAANPPTPPTRMQTTFGYGQTPIKPRPIT